MEKKFETLLKIKYGSLDPKVNLEPDFFTGFDPARRKEIVTETTRSAAWASSCSPPP